MAPTTNLYGHFLLAIATLAQSERFARIDRDGKRKRDKDGMKKERGNRHRERDRAREERLRETKLGEEKEREMSLQRDKETHANGQSTMMQLQPPVRSSND